MMLVSEEEYSEVVDSASEVNIMGCGAVVYQ